MNGILIIDKPKGITSHDVVNIARRVFNIKKVGHAGTLDPIATGVLIILIGSATKKSDELLNDDKSYTATLRLGFATDTGDSSGKATRTGSVETLENGAVKDAIMNFVGEIEQMPPMYSAVKFRGKSLYKWARKGVEVPRKVRKINIKDIRIRAISLPEVIFDVTCSKGTYIRQLCADIGDKLGCGGHMAELRRTRSGAYDISQAITVEKLKSLGSDELKSVLI
ncbi:MAG: tRNA pseudouridine(55) synthase TruB [Candidatus Omnitrophica bacterium]|nr:tRNA pseudouridine(55) synthase TruB [Candidatus Omnitrophota bacterium]